MTPADTAELLALVQVYDHRTVAMPDVAAWHACIGDLDLDPCKQAVIEHYATETAWLMPAHLHRLVRTRRSDPHDGWWLA